MIWVYVCGTGQYLVGEFLQLHHIHFLDRPAKIFTLYAHLLWCKGSNSTLSPSHRRSSEPLLEPSWVIYCRETLRQTETVRGEILRSCSKKAGVGVKLLPLLQQSSKTCSTCERNSAKRVKHRRWGMVWKDPRDHAMRAQTYFSAYRFNVFFGFLNQPSTTDQTPR